MRAKIGIGLLGCGTVGQNVAVRLVSDRAAIERSGGVNYELRSIAVRNEDKVRAATLHPGLFTCNPLTIIDDPDVDLVIECIGGTYDAGDLVDALSTAGATSSRPTNSYSPRRDHDSKQSPPRAA